MPTIEIGQVNLAKDQIRERLIEIFDRTSTDAKLRRPGLQVPSRGGRGALDTGESEKNFCNCTKHLVSLKALSVFPVGHKKLVLAHCASRWLAETNAQVEESFASLAAFGYEHRHEIEIIRSGTSPEDWARQIVTETMLEVFAFRTSETPKIFRSWTNIVFRAELQLLERRSRSGFFQARSKPHASRTLHAECAAIAQVIAKVFRRTLERTLKDLGGTRLVENHRARRGGDDASTSPRSTDLPGDKKQRDASEIAIGVAQKLRDPAGFPIMTIAEAAHAFSRSVATIYRWLDEGKLSRAGKTHMVRTDSARRLLDSD